jgi:hypothetical protein
MQCCRMLAFLVRIIHIRSHRINLAVTNAIVFIGGKSDAPA